MQDTEAVLARGSLDNISGYVSRDSPFFPLYTENVSLDNFLHLDGFNDFEGAITPDFSDALKALIDFSGLSIIELSRNVQMRDEYLLSRIIHRNGKTKRKGIEHNYYEDTTFPPIEFRFLFGLSQPLKEDLLSDIPKCRIEKLKNVHRIPIVFYDSLTGDLVLPRSCSDVNLDYLRGTDGMDEWGFTEYMKNLLLDRRDFLQTSRESSQKGDLDKLPKHYFNFHRGTRMRPFLSHLVDPLELTPVYLPLSPKAPNTAKNKRKIDQHKDKIYSN